MSPLETRPESIAIVGLGPTSQAYWAEFAKKKNIPHVDEVWTVNSCTGIIRADKHFIMDDLKLMERDYPEWCMRLKSLSEPIITCRAYPDYPYSIAYPIEEVIDSLKDDYFSVTPAYMIAYALYIGVKQAFIYGCDFHYPGSPATESGAACMSYWLGIARERRMIFKIPHNSTLLDCHLSRVADGKAGRRYMYGYDYNPGRSLVRINAGQPTELDMLVAAGDKIRGVKAPEKVKPVKPEEA